MSKITFYIIAFLTTSVALAQNYTPLSLHSEKTLVDRASKKKTPVLILYDNLYHKDTGQKLSKEEYKKYYNKDGKSPISFYFDTYGDLSKYIFDPELISQPQKTDRTANPPLITGNSFPGDILTSINNDTIQLKELRNKLVVIHFANIRNNKIDNPAYIREIENQINSSMNPMDIESLLVLTSFDGHMDIAQLQNTVLRETGFKIISKNGNNFMHKWHVARVPSTLIIDKAGNYLGTYKTPFEMSLHRVIK